MKGFPILLDSVRKAMGIGALFLLGLTLAPATTSAQAPPPGGGYPGGPGGGGGSGPTITWTYSGTLTAEASSYPFPYVRQISSAVDMCYSTSSTGQKSIILDAVVTATITWPEGVTVPDKQWMKLFLSASSGIHSGQNGQVSASNGWVDTVTGVPGQSALSEGKHLISRKPSGRQIVITYPIKASVSGTSYSGPTSVSGEMALELTDRKAELFREDNGHKVVSEDGTAYTARTLPTGAMVGPTANVQNLKLLLSGSWNHLPYGTASLNSPTSWMEQVFYFLALTSPAPYSQVFATMVKGYCADDTQTFNVHDPDGYSMGLSWTWKPTYEIQDFVDDQGYPDTYFKPIALIGLEGHSTGPNDPITLTGTYSWGGTISAGSTVTHGITGTVKFPQIPVVFLEPSIAVQVSKSWTETVSVSQTIGGGVNYVRCGENTPAGTTWRMAIGVFYTHRKGKALYTDVLGNQSPNTFFELLFPKSESYGFYPIHESLWGQLNVAREVHYWWGPVSP